jgi:uncharacterized protein
MKKNCTPVQPYHLFEENGRYFAHFLKSGCSFRIDETAYALLELAREFSLEESAEQLLAQGHFEEEYVYDVLSEARQLERAGLFRPAANTLPPAIRESALERRYTTPWTKLELALAETCNLACTYCYGSTVRDMPHSGLMTEDVARQAIDWLFHASKGEEHLGIVFFGGEPLTNKPVFQFVMEYSDQRAKEAFKTINYSMTTNGTLIDDMVVHYVKKHNFGLMVSLDGPPEVHDAQCPTLAGKSSFTKAAAGIKRLMRRRRRVTVRATMTHARPRMMDLIHFYEDFGFTRVVLGRAHNPLHPTPVDLTEEDLDELELEEKAEVVPWILEQLGKGRIPTYFPYMPALEEPKPDPTSAAPISPFRCGACRGTTTVGADGRLYPCHRFVGMSSFVMGNIAVGPDIEFAKHFWRSYDEAVDRQCAGCWARRKCGRPCPWSIAKEDGSFRAPAANECDRLRRGIQEQIYMHDHIQTNFPEVYERLRP